MKKIINFIYILTILSIVSCTEIDRIPTPAFPIANNEETNKQDYTIQTDEIKSNYKEAKNRLKESAKDFDYNKIKNTITVVEPFVFDEAVEKLKGYRVDIDRTIPTEADKKNITYFIHPYTVINSLLDTNHNFFLDSSELIDYPNIKLIDRSKFNDAKNISNHSGIYNLSYGNTSFNLKMKEIYSYSEYLDKVDVTKFNNLEYLTDALYNENYTVNKVLKVSSIGNFNDFNLPSKIFSNINLTFFQAMSPEVQKLARSESIITKNIFDENLFYKLKYNNLIPFTKVEAYIGESGTKYFDITYTNNKDIKYSAQALLLRAMVVSDSGVIYQDLKMNYGSSFSAPRVSMLAYKLKEKYPTLSYQQIKQIILTTADKDESGYLNNSVGWGQINIEKALKGPADFNAGLIDEMKFFESNPSKIFDNEGNRYFYVDVPSDKTYIFSNNITSGLSGDGNTTKSITVVLKGGYNLTENLKRDYSTSVKEYHYRIPLVLDSEKLYYRNIAQAGLRKDGEGILILSGEQKYDAKTQVLKGILILQNNSTSPYEVYNNSLLTIQEQSQEQNISIKDIKNYGVVFFNANTNIDDFTAYEGATTKFNGNKIVRAKNFKNKGSLLVIPEQNSNITDAILQVENEKDLKGISFDNLYLEPVVIKNRLYAKLEYGISNTQIKDISFTKLRNIPSFSVNERNFFKEYVLNNSENWNENEEVSLMSISSTNKEKLKEQIFTDTYNSYVISLFKALDIKDINNDNLILTSQKKNNKISLNTYINSNLIKGDNFTNFSQINSINTLSYSRKLNDKNKIKIYGIYNNQFNLFNNNAKYITHSFNIGTAYSYKNNYEIEVDTLIGMNYTNVFREIKDTSETIKNVENEKLFSLNFNSLITLKKEYQTKNNIISPFITNSLYLINIFEKDNEDYLKIKNNTIIKDKISLGINISTKINNNLNILNRLKSSYLITNDKIILEANLLGKDTKLESNYTLDKFILSYSTGIKYSINDFSISSMLNIDNKLRAGLSINIEYEL